MWIIRYLKNNHAILFYRQLGTAREIIRNGIDNTVKEFNNK